MCLYMAFIHIKSLSLSLVCLCLFLFLCLCLRRCAQPNSWICINGEGMPIKGNQFNKGNVTIAAELKDVIALTQLLESSKACHSTN